MFLLFFMTQELLIFIIAFILPFVYYRALLFFASRTFDKPLLREKTGLKIHHIHYGMILTFLAVVILLFFDKNIYVITLLGLGLGLMYDEFIPALYMKSNRKDELTAYKQSFAKTLIMFILIILMLLLLLFIL